jgi:hypothetical protein
MGKTAVDLSGKAKEVKWNNGVRFLIGKTL